MSAKTKPDLTPTDLLLVKEGQANKLSPRAKGELSYQIAKVESDQSLHLRIQHNSAGGYFSKEWVPISAIESCYSLGIKNGESFTASIFKGTFISQSQNNAGFLGAVLAKEKLITPLDDKSSKWLLDSKKWETWSQELQGAKPIQSVIKQPPVKEATKARAVKPTPKETPSKPTQSAKEIEESQILKKASQTKESAIS